MPNISVILPCYNEGASIAKVVSSLPKEIREIIVVDNNSTDDTATIARNAGAKVVTETTQGYGAAIKTGLTAATGDVLVVVDGDGQYPAEEIVPMARMLDEKNVDFISGNRFPLSERSINPVRIFGNWFLTFAANIIFGLRLKDSQSGMWVFKKSVLNHIKLLSDDMPISQEIKIRVSYTPSLKFYEHHIPYRSRSGVSKLSPIKHGVKNLLFLLKLRLELLHR